MERNIAGCGFSVRAVVFSVFGDPDDLNAGAIGQLEIGGRWRQSADLKILRANSRLTTATRGEVLSSCQREMACPPAKRFRPRGSIQARHVQVGVGSGIGRAEIGGVIGEDIGVAGALN